MNISFLKTHRDSRILHSRTAKNTWQIRWRKIIFKWQQSKLLWIWIFRAVIKVRTTEKNYRYYLGRLLWSCLKPQAGFAEREKKLYCRLDCSSEWLHGGCTEFYNQTRSQSRNEINTHTKHLQSSQVKPTPQNFIAPAGISRGGTLVTRAYIKDSTYSSNIQSVYWEKSRFARTGVARNW